MRNRLVVEWNDTAHTVPATTLPALFEEQTAATPGAQALAHGNIRLTYGELNARANRFARWLIAGGVGPESVVAIVMAHSVTFVTALLAVLKAGGAYLPVDPGYPAARIGLVLADAEPALVLTDATSVPTLPEGVAARVGVLGGGVEDALPPPGSDADRDVTDPDRLRSLSPQNPAYVIYTSGSTGRPKGVVVTHKNLVNYLIRCREEYPGLSEDVLHYTSPYFDLSVTGLFGTLISGGLVRLAAFDERLAAVTEEQKFGFLKTTPSHLVALTALTETWAPTGQLVLGGEQLAGARVRELRKRHPDVAVINEYGPTETTVGCIDFRLPTGAKTPDGAVPIGRPMWNTRAYVLDEALELCPPGVVGELYVAGAQLARGYLGKPGLTAARFVPDPYGPRGTRMYRTGDLVRQHADGELEFVGRADDQVKVRGFRVEPGEIESILAEHEHVARAVATVRREPSSTESLIAYIVPTEGHRDDVRPEDVRRHAAESLPPYLVPSTVVVVDELPLTANGKLDYAALPDPTYTSTATGAGDSTRDAGTAPAQVLAELFAEVLGATEVAADADFMALGGDSLLAARLIGLLRSRYGVRLRMKDLLRGPTVAAVHARLGPEERSRLTAPAVGGTGAVAPIPRVTTLDTAVPLSFAQERLWFLDQLWPSLPDYNTVCALRLRGPLDTHALSRAVDALTSRHDILRTRYVVTGDQPWQVVVPNTAILLSYADCRTGGLPAAEARIHRQWAEPFDLSAGLPFRALLLTVADEDHILSLVLHHIATDKRSNDLLMADLAALYVQESGAGPVAAAGANRRPTVSGVRYADYGQWQRARLNNASMRTDLAYWRGELGGADAISLPTDRPRPAVRTGRGAQLDFTVSGALRDSLVELGKAAGTTLFMTMLAAFHLLVAKHTGRRDIAVGIPVAGRTHPDVESVVGFFVNTLVLRAHLDPETDFLGLLDQVGDKAAGAYAHSEFPFEKLVEELRPERDLGSNPLFQLMFDMTTADGTAGEEGWPGLVAEPFRVSFCGAKFDFEIGLTDRNTDLAGSAYYATDLFDEETVHRFIQRYLGLLRQLTDDPRRPLGEIDVLSGAERDQLAAWNDTARAYDTSGSLPEQITRQCQRTPDAIAVEHGPAHLSYRELDEQSARFARLLVSCGATADAPVGVWVDRGLDLMVALLGVLKAGCAYLPLDPDLPPTRVRTLLDESAAALCVVAGEPSDRRLPPNTGVTVVRLDRAALAQLPGGTSGVMTHPDDLVSVYYTSGSSGRPKGVANTHRGWLNRMWWMQDQHPLRPGDGVLHKTVLSFDDAAVELFWPLLVGARIVMLDPGLHGDPRAIARAIAEHEVAVMQFVPSVLELFLDEISPDGSAALACLRHVISSGESLRPDLVRRFCEVLGSLGRGLHNQWGPTEASIDATLHTCAPSDARAATVPIGLPLANCQVHVLDEQFAPVPPGVEGELFVGGVGLARGYWNDPARTAASFVPDPFHKGARLYRTGDRGVRRMDGEILFRGRLDHQVKIRGNRIELGEIELALLAHPDVRDAAVTVWEPVTGDRRLVAYAVPADTTPIRPDVLRRALADQLPAYMVPSVVIPLGALPRAANGKLDRRALPDPEADEREGRSPTTGRAPASDGELLVAEVWREFLDATDVEANFFELGGHSLLATKIISRLRRVLECELPLVLLFANPTIAGLAGAVEQELLATVDGAWGGEA